jgi:hypothetical protein
MISASVCSSGWRKRPGHREGVTIAVRDGVVDLSDFDETKYRVLRVAAENPPGVTHVENHLVWIEPASGTIIDAPQQEGTATKP